MVAGSGGYERVRRSSPAGTLNRAEWVKFLGLFFNKEKEASNYFDSVEKQYNTIKVQPQSQWQALHVLHC